HPHPGLSTKIFLFYPSLPHRALHFPYTTLFRSSASFARSGGRANLRPKSRQSAFDATQRQGGRRGSRFFPGTGVVQDQLAGQKADRKSTRLNSSHVAISYAVFCLKKKHSLVGVV